MLLDYLLEINVVANRLRRTRSTFSKLVMSVFNFSLQHLDVYRLQTWDVYLATSKKINSGNYGTAISCSISTLSVQVAGSSSHFIRTMHLHSELVRLFSYCLQIGLYRFLSHHWWSRQIILISVFNPVNCCSDTFTQRRIYRTRIRDAAI